VPRGTRCQPGFGVSDSRPGSPAFGAQKYSSSHGTTSTSMSGSSGIVPRFRRQTPAVGSFRSHATWSMRLLAGACARDRSSPLRRARTSLLEEMAGVTSTETRAEPGHEQGCVRVRGEASLPFVPEDPRDGAPFRWRFSRCRRCAPRTSGTGYRCCLLPRPAYMGAGAAGRCRLDSGGRYFAACPHGAPTGTFRGMSYVGGKSTIH
jgi:hypothetical protein